MGLWAGILPSSPKTGEETGLPGIPPKGGASSSRFLGDRAEIFASRLWIKSGGQEKGPFNAAHRAGVSAGFNKNPKNPSIPRAVRSCKNSFSPEMTQGMSSWRRQVSKSSICLRVRQRMAISEKLRGVSSSARLWVMSMPPASRLISLAAKIASAVSVGAEISRTRPPCGRFARRMRGWPGVGAMALKAALTISGEER